MISSNQWFPSWREYYCIKLKIIGAEPILANKLKITGSEIMQTIELFLSKIRRLCASWELPHPGLDRRLWNMDQVPHWLNKARYPTGWPELSHPGLERRYRSLGSTMTLSQSTLTPLSELTDAIAANDGSQPSIRLMVPFHGFQPSVRGNFLHSTVSRVTWEDCTDMRRSFVPLVVPFNRAGIPFCLFTAHQIAKSIIEELASPRLLSAIDHDSVVHMFSVATCFNAWQMLIYNANNGGMSPEQSDSEDDYTPDDVFTLGGG